MIARQKSIQSVALINSSNAIVGTIYSIKSSITQYFSLRQTNEALLKENALLKNKEHSAFIDTLQDVVKTIPITAVDSTLYLPIDEDTTIVGNDSTKNKSTTDSSTAKTGIPKVVRYASYHYIPARVINNSLANDKMNYLTINQGRNAGITKNMAVVTSNGIVGRVVNVSDHFATVLSILSEGRSYNVRLEDGSEFFIHWDKDYANLLTIDKVPKRLAIKKGDNVYTTGHSLFPENVIVGKIIKIEIDKITNTKVLRILPSNNFRKMQFVYVVKDDLSPEKSALEDSTIEQAQTDNNQ